MRPLQGGEAGWWRSRASATRAPDGLPGTVSSDGVRRFLAVAIAAATLVACKETADIWAEEPDYSGAPTRLCDAAREGAAQATYGKLFEFEGPMDTVYAGSPVLGEEPCLATCYFPHDFPDTDFQPGDRVRLRGRIRQYRIERTTWVELDPCVFHLAASPTK